MLYLYPEVQHMFLKEGNIHTLYHFINNWGCCCLRNQIRIHISVLVKARIQPAVLRGLRYPIWFNSMFEFCQNLIHSIFDSILLCPKFNSKYYSIKKNLLIQFKRWFNSIDRGSLILVELEKCPKIAQKVSKIDKKGGFSSKMANIDSKYDSFIHFRVKFNSKEYSI